MKFLEFMLQVRDSVFGQVFVMSILGYASYRWLGRAKWLPIAGMVVWAVLFVISLVNMIAYGDD